jgi:hypothetical protein
MVRKILAASLLWTFASYLTADTVSFSFARVGTSYSAALFQDSPLVNHEVTGARIILDVEIYPESDGANFVADLAMPIDPNPGNTNAIVLNGVDLGWSGDGIFNYFAETDEFNGFLVARRYGAATYGEGYAGQILDGRIELDVPTYIRGDFNVDLKLDARDIDSLSEQIRSGEATAWYDLDQDGEVNDLDRSIWVEEIRNTYFGDSNLDGEFNSTDFVKVFQAAEYEDAVKKNSTWETGDWTGDAEFDSSDFVLAFQRGGFEQGPRNMAAVPEPRTSLFVFVGSIAGMASLLRKSIGG